MPTKKPPAWLYISIVPDDIAFMKEKTNRMKKKIMNKNLFGPSLFQLNHIQTAKAPPTA